MKSKYTRPFDVDDILEQLTSLEKAKGTFVIPGPKSPVSDQFKFKLCQQILKFKMKRELTNVDLAEMLKVNQPRVSEICRCQYHLFTIDWLIDLVQILAQHDKEIKTKIEKGLIAFNP